MTKIIGLLILVILAGAGYMWWNGSLGDVLQVPPADTNAPAVVQPTATSTATSTAPAKPVSVLPTPIDSVTDESLATDAKALDTEIANLQKDATTMNTAAAAPTGI